VGVLDRDKVGVADPDREEVGVDDPETVIETVGVVDTVSLGDDVGVLDRDNVGVAEPE
jgi:hypothetical protein